jgi:hypothetical protein
MYVQLCRFLYAYRYRAMRVGVSLCACAFVSVRMSYICYTLSYILKGVCVRLHVRVYGFSACLFLWLWFRSHACVPSLVPPPKPLTVSPPAECVRWRWAGNVNRRAPVVRIDPWMGQRRDPSVDQRCVNGPLADLRICPCARRAPPHAPALHGRDISSTKVKALPESLGKCKDLQHVCVRAATYCAWCAGVALLGMRTAERRRGRRGALMEGRSARRSHARREYPHKHT